MPLAGPQGAAARRGLLGATLLGLLLGCAGPSRAPDLARLYASTRATTDQPPVILIHGILGSRLRTADERKEIWVGQLRKLLFSDYSDLKLAIDPDTLEPVRDGLEPYAIFDRAAGTDFYGRIITVLQNAGGFTRGEPGLAAAAGTRRFYVFRYDWRRDNVENASRLDALIDQIRVDYADPALKVDIVAHSMGGLLTRYYLRYGTQDVLNDNEFPVNLWGATRVRRVVLLGTPNLGSVNSVRAFIDGVKLGFGRIRTEVLATMPSVYQLFPHPVAGAWLINAQGEQLDRDVFSARIWRRFQWSIFDPKVRARIRAGFEDPAAAQAYLDTLERYFEKHLERARRFVWSLTVPLEETPWQLIVFGGDCELTPARMLVEEVDGVSTLRLDPRDIDAPDASVDYARIMLEPGDGTVTKASLLARNALDPTVPRHRYVFFPLDYSLFICESHDQLTGNVTFQDNLLHVLLSR
ncbi:MAG: hypothetical protein AAGA23_07585 [Pseudomonadota bacterium]